MKPEDRMAWLEQEISREALELRFACGSREWGRVGSIANRIAQLVAEYKAWEQSAEEALP